MVEDDLKQLKCDEVQWTVGNCEIIPQVWLQQPRRLHDRDIDILQGQDDFEVFMVHYECHS